MLHETGLEEKEVKAVLDATDANGDGNMQVAAKRKAAQDCQRRLLRGPLWIPLAACA